MTTTTLEVPKSLLSDYQDGYDRMKTVLARLSAAGVIGYADTAGPALDVLADGHEFHDGMRAALSDGVDRALLTIPNLVSNWDRKDLS